MTGKNEKNILMLAENDIIVVDGQECRVLFVDVSESGKTAKIFYDNNGVGDFLRVSTKKMMEVIEQGLSNLEEVEPEEGEPEAFAIFQEEKSNVVHLFQHRKNPNALSQEYQEYYSIIQKEFKEVNEFYMKHILSMPAMVKKSIELTMEEMKEARQHIMDKHQADIGEPLPLTK